MLWVVKRDDGRYLKRKYPVDCWVDEIHNATIWDDIEYAAYVVDAILYENRYKAKVQQITMEEIC